MKILCFLGVLMLKACEAPDVQHYFKINNEANHMISYYVGESYPDTLIVQAKPVLKTVQSNSSFKESDWGTWDERFSQIEGGKISVFIFHTDTLKKYSWEEIRDGYKILKRYDLSLEDLEETDFTITNGVVTNYNGINLSGSPYLEYKFLPSIKPDIVNHFNY